MRHLGCKFLPNSMVMKEFPVDEADLFFKERKKMGSIGKD